MSEGVEPPSISGALAIGLRDVVAERVGADVVARALARVPADVRDAYGAILPIGWMPIASMESVFGAIATEVGRDVADLHMEVARVSVARTMKTFWRVLLRFTTESALISRTPVIYARSYNRGRLEAEVPSPGRGEIELLDWPGVPDWPLRAVGIGVATVLDISGRKGADVTWTRTPNGAHFRAVWS